MLTTQKEKEVNVCPLIGQNRKYVETFFISYQKPEYDSDQDFVSNC